VQNFVGTQVHDEILGLIDRAERVVVLVSPFVRMWPDLKRALARAVCRGVSITLITRGPQGGPSPEDLDVFDQLEADIKEVPVLHLKAYLSEKEAIHTSVNLTRQSVGKSIESSLLFDRERDAEGWAQVYEIWQKVLDDHERADEEEPTDFDKIAAHMRGEMPSLRERADAGDLDARDDHCYCIACGKTSSADADEVVCLRCRASALAEGRRPEDVAGTRCARCNKEYSRATAQYPLCDSCFHEERRRYDQRVARWYVAGSRDAIETWWRYEESGKGLLRTSDPRLNAVARRFLALTEGGWVSTTLTGSTTLPVDLWRSATMPSLLDGKALDGLVVERVPSIRLPPCKELPNFDPTEALHAVYTRHADPRRTALWADQVQLATWDVALDRSRSGHRLAAPDWQWKAILAPRRSFSDDQQLNADRVHLKVEIELGVPEDLRDKWLMAVDHLLPLLLASLHTYSEDEAKELLGAETSPKGQLVAQALTMPAPLGQAALVRSRNGKVRAFPSRPDRVVALRATVAPAEGWHLKASISTAQKAPVH
jgi:PLD-like domain